MAGALAYRELEREAGMAKPIRVSITGPSGIGVDAPTVDDLLGQVRDLVEVLRGVERAIAPGAGQTMVWRVTGATMNSPISLELTPYAEDSAVPMEARAEQVEQAAASGFLALQRGEPRPAYFTDDVLAKARRLHSRVLNGLSDTVIKFSGSVSTAPIVIDRPVARSVELAVERAKGAQSIPYRELGSIEGFVTKPELDGFGRAVLRFRTRLGGVEVKAYASGNAFKQVERLRLSDVWHGVRVRVYGTINYKGLGQIECINATAIEVLDAEHLPSCEHIVDPMFTGGLSSEEFLRELRRDD